MLKFQDPEIRKRFMEFAQQHQDNVIMSLKETIKIGVKAAVSPSLFVDQTKLDEFCELKAKERAITTISAVWLNAYQQGKPVPTTVYETFIKTKPSFLSLQFDEQVRKHLDMIYNQFENDFANSLNNK